MFIAPFGLLVYIRSFPNTGAHLLICRVGRLGKMRQFAGVAMEIHHGSSSPLQSPEAFLLGGEGAGLDGVLGNIRKQH